MDAVPGLAWPLLWLQPVFCGASILVKMRACPVLYGAAPGPGPCRAPCNLPQPPGCFVPASGKKVCGLGPNTEKTI